MGLPTVTQTWTISPNNRYVFVSVIGATGALMYSWTQFLITTMGWTCKGSCDGTTGAMDGVNRITAANKWATRNNGAAGAQSWIVVTDGAGINWCYSFNSASDDIVRLAHSTGGNYVAAGTPAQQPTATDECFDAASGTWVNSTASLDRVWHMWGNSDKKMARLAVCRNNVCVMYLQTEKFTSALVSPATFSLATGGGTVGAVRGYHTVASAGLVAANGLIAGSSDYTATSAGYLCRVHAGGADGNAKCGASGENLGPSSFFGPNYTVNEKPQLQGGTGELLFPANIATRANSPDGKLGNLIDQWFAWANAAATPALGDAFGSLQFIALGSAVVIPWDSATLFVSI